MISHPLVPTEVHALRFLAQQGGGWASYRRLSQAGVRSQTLGSLAFQDLAAERDDGWRITPTGILAIADTLPLKTDAGSDNE